MPIMVIIEVIIVILLALLFLNISKRNASRKNQEHEQKVIKFEDNVFPFKDKLPLTKNEYSFYLELKKIADQESLIIFPKIGLKELFDVTNKENYMIYFRKISQKHVDFLLCDSELNPKYAIEIDDSSHVSATKQESDTFKNKLFKGSKIQLVRIKADTSYSEEYIRSRWTI